MNGHISLDTQPIVLEVEASEGEEPTRTIAGLAVPWDSVGMTSAGRTKFARGSLPTNPLPHALRDHDRTRVVGRVTAAEDRPEGMWARARLSDTPLGSETLVLAADGVLQGLSVGVEVTSHHYEDGVLVVDAGVWRELSVLPFQAFTESVITDVAAHEQEPTLTDIPNDPEPDDPEPERRPTSAPVPSRPASRLMAGQVAHLMILAQRGDVRAREVLAQVVATEPPSLTAALAQEATGTNEGIVPPSYSSDILGGLPVATPFLSNLCRKTGLPATGMAIIKPEWGTLPKGDWVAAENTQPPTGPVNIGSKTVSVLTYAHAVQASLNLVNRSDFGGFSQAYYQQVAIDYTAKKEARALETAQGAAAAVAVTATSTQGLIGALVSACIAQQCDTSGTSDEFRGLMPEFAAVAPNLWEDLVETSVLNGPAFSTGSIQWGTMAGSLSGLVIVMVPGLAAGKALVGARAATVVHDEAEAQLRALVVNTLSVELGVIANCAFDVEYPLALAKNAAAFVPTSTGTTSTSKSSK